MYDLRVIRVDTTGLAEAMKGIPIFAKESEKLEDEWSDAPVVEHIDTDTGIQLLVPGFESKRFKSHWSKINKTLLVKQHGKCAYCESMMAAVSHADVEHFRPKAGFDPATGGTASANLAGIRGGLVRSGYFWLAYAATNYYLSCAICNQVYKKNRFDVLPDSARPTAKNRNVFEKPMYIDPGLEEPRELIRFDPYTALAVPAKVWDAYLKEKGARDPLGLEGSPKPTTGLKDVEKEMEERLDRLGVIWQFLNFTRRALEKDLEKCAAPDKLTQEAEKAAQKKLEVSSDSSMGSLDPEPLKSPESLSLTIDRKLELEITTFYGPYDYEAKAFKELLWKAAFFYLRARDTDKLKEIEQQVRKDNPITDMVDSEAVDELVKKAVGKHIEDLRTPLYRDARRELRAQRRLNVATYTTELIAKDVVNARALYSILNLGLNRRELIRRRALHLARLRGLVLFLKVAKNWNGVNFLEKVLESAGKDPPEKTSDAADEIQAAYDTLRLAVSPKGEYSSLSIDALLAWSFTLLEELKLAQSNQNIVNVKADPWLFRYYEIAMKPIVAEKSPEDDEETTESDDVGDDVDPTIAALTDPAEATYYVVLHRFGLPYTKIAKRYGLKAAEMNVVTQAISVASKKLSSKIEAEYYAELLRLLMFHASAKDIVESCPIPEFSSDDDDPTYWKTVDERLNKLENSYKALVLHQAAKKTTSPRLTDDTLFDWWFAGQSPSRKKKKKALRTEFKKLIK